MTLIRLFLITSISIICAYNPAIAVEEKHTFKDLENLAIEQDYTVAALLQKLQATESKRAAASAQYLPRFSTHYRFFGDGLNLVNEDFGSKHFLSLRLSQDLIKLTRVRSKRIDSINAEMDILKSQLQQAKRLAVLEFRNDYVEILQNRSRILYYEKLIKTYEKLLEIKQNRFKEQEELLTEVLQIEKELINVKGLYTYYQTQIEKQKNILAEFFALNPSEITWDETGLTHANIHEDKLLALAVQNSDGFRLNQARSRLADVRAKTAMYENFMLTPFLGLRVRGDKIKKLKTAPEVGVSFSIPLWFNSIRSQKHKQFKSQSNSSRLEAEGEVLELKEDLISVLHEYQLLAVQIKNKDDILDLFKEKARIQRSRHNNGLRNLKLDAVHLLELEAEIAVQRLERTIYKYEQDKLYYELIYLSGLIRPEDFSHHLSKDRDIAKNDFTRALWLWNAAEVLKENSKKDFIDFCQARGINKVFVSINKKVLSSIEHAQDLRTFIADLHDADLKVSALMGEPIWVYEKNRQNLIRRIQFVLEYNTNANDRARFDAIHLDIEPHALAEWGDHKSYLINNLAETITLAKQTVSHGIPKLELEIDLPTFYHKVDRAALEKIVQNVDLVTVMAYERPTSESVMKSVANIVELVNRMDKKFLIGFNAKDFNEEKRLEDLIRNVGMKVSIDASFSGLAIHDYHHYRDLIKNKDAL